VIDHLIFKTKYLKKTEATMKMNKKLVSLCVTLILSTHFSSVAQAVDVDGNADATVIAPLSIVENAAMDFGTVAGGANADTIVMDTAGGRTVTGTDAQIIATGPGSAGNFTITGEPNQAYTVTFSASATLDDGGGNTMTVDTFTDNSPSPLSGAGTDTLLVGGTLNIGANQAAGAYSTNFGGTPYTVTVNYN
jgi:hypothetical protein